MMITRLGYILSCYKVKVNISRLHTLTGLPLEALRRDDNKTGYILSCYKMNISRLHSDRVTIRSTETL